ncbi:hypothetical protein [Klebsiella quasipneumoniae]|uniref:hypothetical protein n=1 Tax=Klebsiella quasipneumoniae TaxID=1463165 RepID=UPI001E33459A|nr:hypothetical protein [Klebsiella quasipneumoniae]
MFAGKKSAQIREILISESAWEEMTCLFAPSLRKPQNLWSVYRTAQRKIETTLIHYKYKTEDYEETSDVGADKLLISKVISFATEAHHMWIKALPDTNSLKESIHIEAKDK